ncbi:hypothetical protein [Sediminibacillus albus]|uniref:Uncharacterized protein n=1 Tax=Sediminibacillus albus TaxID=407036 RepID=A0A1G8WUM1_9BACI|nr:hypothetical protein [Sediminibacillus albus]SDJ81746.1 hypothetical protein SAMN05216243_0997 [Sediminibacillus albus]
MTMFGWIFWGLIALIILFAVFLQLKFKRMKTPGATKSAGQMEAEERVRNHPNNFPPGG